MPHNLQLFHISYEVNISAHYLDEGLKDLRQLFGRTIDSEDVHELCLLSCIFLVVDKVLQKPDYEVYVCSWSFKDFEKLLLM